ncbi:MAG: thioredoxin domain-containing protein [Myxococcota bacterium]
MSSAPRDPSKSTDQTSGASTKAEARGKNRLAKETSAYLRQHEENPVDWYPWGEEALARAKAEDKPILVSIGYSACHWCHVMERECFENPEIAAQMNDAFINIKVDREERPDVDQIYMSTALKLNGRGGWPLNAVCTPDGRPFFVGTYFPPERRGEMPSFPEILGALSDAWRDQRDEIEDNSAKIVAALSDRPPSEAGQSMPGSATIQAAAKAIMETADLSHGGFGRAPKFPTPPNLELLTASLDFFEHDTSSEIARFLALTAREMSRRGLFDQLGGGFHRYCTDVNWTIPHFEKMLYDQGQLLSFYAELARRAHDASDLLWPITETADYLTREMQGEGGAFFASQDADSEGEEGKFFVWTPLQIAAHLGDEADAFCTSYGVRLVGNFENGTTQLVDEARAKRSDFEAARKTLLAARSERVAPATDPKHVTAWNGYVISGLARAASVVGDAALRDEATRAADFILSEMTEDGQLLRIHDGGRAHISGFLDDYAAMLGACLDLHRAGAGERFLESATRLGDQILSRFANPATGALYLVAEDAKDAKGLVHRPRSDHDGATPDASGLALLGLTRLAALGHRSDLDAFVTQAIAESAALIKNAPHAFPTLLRAVALRVRGLSAAVIIGDPEDPQTTRLADRARRVLRPEDAVLVASPEAASNAPSAGIAPEWLAGRSAINGKPTAYICHGTLCSAPVQEPSEIVVDLVPGA